MVTSVSGLSWKLSSVGVAVAVAIGLAAPAHGQANPAATSTSEPNRASNVQPSAAQTLPQAQPVPQQSATPPSAPAVTGAPAATPAPNGQPQAGQPTANPSNAGSTSAAVPETTPPMPEGVRRTADGRMSFAGSATVDLPSGGKRGVKSLLNLTKSLSYGEYVWDERGIPKGRIWVLVDPAHQLISVFRGKHEIGTAVTLYGADAFPTPPGHFRILARMKDHRSRTYNNAPMPYTLRLTNDGVSIHGNNVMEGYASHGCVGVPLDFARRLFAEARVGDEVFILRDKQAKITQK
jgi:L,D-transpeptidase catalytic domain